MRKWVRMFGIGTLVVFSLAVLVETVIRSFSIASAQRVDQTSYEQVLGDLAPDQDLESLENTERPYRVQVNSQGFRGPELLPRSPERKRVLVLGDSVAFGQFIDEGHTLTDYVRQSLQPQAFKQKYEVINASRCGYSIGDQLDYFVDKGQRLHADYVFLVFSVGDVVERSWAQSPREVSLTRGRFRSSASPLVWVEKMFRKSAAIYAFQQWRMRMVKPDQIEAARGLTALQFDDSYEQPLSEAFLKALHAYIDDLRRLQHLVQQQGGEFVLVLFPSEPQVRRSDLPALPQLHLKKMALQMQMRIIDLLPIFREVGDAPLLYFPEPDTHPRSTAAAIAGKELGRYTRFMETLRSTDPSAEAYATGNI